MFSIRKPDKHEILEALCRLENGEELTDRDIWILDEYTDWFYWAPILWFLFLSEYWQVPLVNDLNGKRKWCIWKKINKY